MFWFGHTVNNNALKFNTEDSQPQMVAHVLLTTSFTVDNSVNSKPERKFDSLPLLGLDPATFDTPATTRSDHTANPHSNLYMYMGHLIYTPAFSEVYRFYPF
jgi:hypothetical protein